MRRIMIIAACLAGSTALAEPVPTVEEIDAAFKRTEVVSTLPKLRAMRAEIANVVAAGDCKEAIRLTSNYEPAFKLTVALASLGNAPEDRSRGLAQPDHQRPSNSDLAAAAIHEMTVALAQSYVEMAECAQVLGTHREAIAVYTIALRAIPASETALWERAANGLWRLLGIE